MTDPRIYDLETGYYLTVSKAKDIKRTAFPIKLMENTETIKRYRCFSVGNTSDAWTAIAYLANSGRISQFEAGQLRAEADRLASNLKHLDNGNWIETKTPS